MKNTFYDPIIKQLSETLKKEIGKNIKDIILFGSRARGNFHLESDYDLIVLVDRESKEIKDKIFTLSCEIGWKHNVVITVFVHEKGYYEKKKYEPLFMNIRKEGIHV